MQNRGGNASAADGAVAFMGSDPVPPLVLADHLAHAPRGLPLHLGNRLRRSPRARARQALIPDARAHTALRPTGIVFHSRTTATAALPREGPHRPGAIRASSRAATANKEGAEHP